MPTFTAESKSEVVDFLIDSFEKDPRLSYDPFWVPPETDDDYEQDGDQDGHFSCLYRGPEGTQCAFGRCVTDEELEESPFYEGKAASVLAADFGFDTAQAFANIAPFEHAGFWDSLQMIHDTVARLTFKGTTYGQEPSLTGKNIPAMLAKWREIGYPSLEGDTSITTELAES